MVKMSTSMILVAPLFLAHLIILHQIMFHTCLRFTRNYCLCKSLLMIITAVLSFILTFSLLRIRKPRDPFCTAQLIEDCISCLGLYNKQVMLLPQFFSATGSHYQNGTLAFATSSIAPFYQLFKIFSFFILIQ